MTDKSSTKRFGVLALAVSFPLSSTAAMAHGGGGFQPNTTPLPVPTSFAFNNHNHGGNSVTPSNVFSNTSTHFSFTNNSSSSSNSHSNSTQNHQSQNTTNNSGLGGQQNHNGVSLIQKFGGENWVVGGGTKSSPNPTSTLSVPTTSSNSQNNGNQSNARTLSLNTVSSSGQVTKQSGPQLDLTSSSTDVSITKGVLGSNSSVTINVGGTNVTVQAGDKVTAAEYVAVVQKVDGNSQTLSIDSTGKASGGTFALDSLANKSGRISASELVIPTGVTATDNVVADPSLRVTGDLVNNGVIDAISANSSASSGKIIAIDITNSSSGTIGTQLNGASTSTIDLTLSASNNFTNSGSITGNGALTVGSGGTLTNSGSTALMKSANDLTLQASSIVNSGIIKSVNTNINVQSPSDITINGTGGSFVAANGDINIRDASYNGAGNTTLTGGNYLSNNLNVYSGTGNISGALGDVTGKLNTFGMNADVTAASTVLNIGTSKIIEDPTYANSAGSIAISGTLDFGAAATFIASGNITTAAGTTISTRDGIAGDPITMIAGANVSITPPGTSTSTISDTSQLGVVATINGTTPNSAAGGSITLGTGTTLNASALNEDVSANGGAVTLIAMRGTSGAGGTINFAGSVINSSGSGAGTNGNVLILAGSNTGTSITTGTIDAGSLSGPGNQRGTGGGGTITIQTAQAQSNGTPGSNDIVYQATGIQSSTSSLVAGASATGAVALGASGSGDAIYAASDISITGTKGITVNAGTVTSDQGSVALTATNSTILFAATSTGVTANNNLTLNSGTGAIQVAPQTNTPTAITWQATTGNVAITAASVTASGDQLSVAAGGNIDAANVNFDVSRVAAGTGNPALSLAAFGSITAGNLTASTPTRGGHIIVTAGQDPTSNAINNTFANINIGNVTSNGTSGGTFNVVDNANDTTPGDTPNSINIGSITVNGGAAASSSGGGVSIQSLNYTGNSIVTGAISATAGGTVAGSGTGGGVEISNSGHDASNNAGYFGSSTIKTGDINVADAKGFAGFVSVQNVASFSDNLQNSSITVGNVTATAARDNGFGNLTIDLENKGDPNGSGQNAGNNSITAGALSAALIGTFTGAVIVVANNGAAGVNTTNTIQTGNIATTGGAIAISDLGAGSATTAGTNSIVLGTITTSFGTGAGNAGNVTIASTYDPAVGPTFSPTLTLTTGAITANGGSTGGNGGAIAVTLSPGTGGNGGAVTANLGAVTANALAGNGGGGSLTVLGQSAASDSITTGAIAVNGIGTGTGGVVKIVNDTAAAGGVTTGSIQTGNISAIGGATGTAGGVLLENESNGAAGGMGTVQAGTITVTGKTTNVAFGNSINIFNDSFAGGESIVTSTLTASNVGGGSGLGIFMINAGGAADDTATSITTGNIVSNGAVNGSGGNITIVNNGATNPGNLSGTSSATISTGTITANGIGSGSGGAVTIISTVADKSNVVATSNFTTGAITVNGGTTGSGGGIELEVGETSPSFVRPSSTTANIGALSANGVNGGDISVITQNDGQFGGNVSVTVGNVSTTGTTGTGGSVVVQDENAFGTGTNKFVVGTINASGAAGTNGIDVENNAQEASSNTVTVGAITATGKNLAGLSSNNQSVNFVNSAQNTPNGTITLGAITATSSDGSAKVSLFSNDGATGKFTVGAVNVNGVGTNANGGEFVAEEAGLLTLSTVTANGAATNGGGGFIDITPGNLFSAGLSANGVGTGLGGTVDVTTGSTNALVLSSAKTGNNDIYGAVSALGAGGAVAIQGAAITLTSATAIKAGGIAQLIAHTGDISGTGAGPSAPTVNLQSLEGNIGTAAAPITTTTSTLGVNDPNGSTFVKNTGAALALQFLGPINNLTLTNTGSVTIGNVGTIGGSLSVTAGANNNINYSNNINANTAITLITSGTGGIVPTGGAILIAPTVTLGSGTTGIGSISDPVQIQAANLAVSTTGAAYVSDNQSVQVLTSSATGLQGFNLTTPGAVTITGILTGSADISSSAFDIAAAGAIKAGTTGFVTLAPFVETANVTVGTGTGYVISTAALSKITAASVGIDGGAITVNGTINMTGGTKGSTPGTYNLLLNGSTVDSSAGTIIMPTTNLTLFGAGSVNVGKVQSANLDVVSSGVVTLSGPISGTTLSLFGTQVNINSSVLETNASVTATAGGITISPSVSSVLGSTALTLQASGNINVGGAIGGGTVSITSTTGSIEGQSVTGTTVNLKAVDIGQVSPLRTAATTLTVNATDSATIFNTLSSSPLTLGASTVGNVFTLVANGALTTTGTIAAPTLSLTAGSIAANSAVGSAGGTTTLTATNTGNISGTGTISGGTVNLFGGGSVTAKLDPAAGTLNITSGTTATITDTGALTLGNVASGGILTATAFEMTTKGSITAPTINLTSTGKFIAIESAVGTPGVGTVNLTSTGTGELLTQFGGIVSGNIVNLKNTSSKGINGPFDTDANTLTVNTTGAASINNVNTGNTNLGASTVGAGLTLFTNGNLTTTGTISSTSSQISLFTNNGGNIIVNSTVGSATSATLLDTDTSGNISGTGTVMGATVFLTSGTGNIGTPMTALKTASPDITAITAGAGTVNLNNTVTGTLTLENSSSGGDFKLTTNGNVTLNNIATAGVLNTQTGNISVINNGALVVNSGAQIVANEGSVLLQNNNTTSGTITINGGMGSSSSNTFINGHTVGTNTALGNVTITIGAAKQTNTMTVPSFITPNVSGGTIFYGTVGSITGSGTTTVNAQGRTVTFSSARANSIDLVGPITITADPPVATGSATASSASSSTPLSTTLLSTSVLPGSQASSSGGQVQTSSIASGSTNSVLGFADATPASNSVVLNVPVVQNVSVSVPAPTFSVVEPNLVANQTAAYAPSTLALTVPQLGTAAQAPSLSMMSSTTNANNITSTSSNINTVAATDASSQNRLGAMLQGGVEALGSTDAIEGTIWQSAETADSNSSERNSSKFMIVDDGNMLFVPATNVTVKTPVGSIDIAAKSVVLVMSNQSRLAVFNLDDTHPNAVVVHEGSENIALSPGRQTVVVRKDVGEFGSVNPSESLGYRRMSKRMLTNGNFAFISDFSLGSALCAMKPVKDLVNSDQPEHVKIARHLAKTHGIMVQMNQAPYEQIARPRMTAMR